MNRLQIESSCPASLSESHITQFKNEGYLAFENFLSPIELDAARAAIFDFVEARVDDYRSGKISVEQGGWGSMSNYMGKRLADPKTKAYVLFEDQMEMDLDEDAVEKINLAFRKISGHSEHDPRLRQVLRHPHVLNHLKSLMGCEATLFGEQALCKPPEIGSEKPWHQDQAYHHYLPVGAGVTVWVALDDATIENGCMHIIPGGHLSGPRKHVSDFDYAIADDCIDTSEALPVEIKAGGMLMISSILPHQTPANRSAQRRRALQFFYRSSQSRLVEAEEFKQKFV